jgi:hypothetical protein
MLALADRLVSWDGDGAIRFWSLAGEQPVSPRPVAGLDQGQEPKSSGDGKGQG